MSSGIIHLQYLDNASKYRYPVKYIYGLGAADEKLLAAFDKHNIDAETNFQMFAQKEAEEGSYFYIPLINIHNKHAALEVIECPQEHLTAFAGKKPGIINLELLDANVIKIHLAFSAENKNEYSIYYEKSKYSSFKRTNIFFPGRIQYSTEFPLKVATLLASPDYYRELEKDCLEFAKSWVIFFQSLSNERDSEDMNRLKTTLGNLSISELKSWEATSRRKQFFNRLGQSLLGNSIPFNIVLMIIISFLVSYLVKHYT